MLCATTASWVFRNLSIPSVKALLVPTLEISKGTQVQICNHTLSLASLTGSFSFSHSWPLGLFSVVILSDQYGMVTLSIIDRWSPNESLYLTSSTAWVSTSESFAFFIFDWGRMEVPMHSWRTLFSLNLNWWLSWLLAFLLILKQSFYSNILVVSRDT